MNQTEGESLPFCVESKSGEAPLMSGKLIRFFPLKKDFLL